MFLKSLFRFGLFATLAFAVAACDSTTGPTDGSAQVSVAFRGLSAGASSSVGPNVSRSLGASALTLVGSNGTLTLDEVWMIVAEFELEREGESDCLDVDDVDDDDCEEFEAPPQFISLPLDGAALPAVVQDVPPGVYGELEFEVEDLDDDDDEGSGEAGALLATIRAQFPDWPEDASMLVTGSFTPTGGSAQAFSVYFEAEIEVESEFEPALDLTSGETASVTVVVDPALWFAVDDGTVMDLSAFQGQLVEFEAELEDGFTDVEFDDDD